MTPELIGVIGIIALLVLFLARIPVAVSLIVLGLLGTAWIRGWDVAFSQLGRTTFDTAGSYSLSVIPLFILMGLFLSSSGIGQDLYRFVDSIVGHIRGGLAMATVGTAALFSSISGSLNATTVTVGRITLPEMKKYHYHPQLSTASVVAGGTLGSLIPPSVVLVLYGILTREPIGKLLVAGIIPGIVQFLLFLLTVYLIVRRKPAFAPQRTEKVKMRDRLLLMLNVLPFIVIFILVIGGIYRGIFTPTEAAAIGSFTSLVVALLVSIKTKQMTLKSIGKAFNETVRLTAYIFLILMGANLFSQFITITRIPVKLTGLLADLDMNMYVVLALMLVTLFILGCFIEGLSLMVLTLPITYPIVTQFGFSGIWFGVIMTMTVNLAAVTPPLGVGVYDVKGVARDVPLETIFKGVIPFIVAMIAGIALMIAFPDLVLYLTDRM